MTNEKRLIDANAADVEEISCYYGSNCNIENVQSWLDEQPTIDAVEVVRCEECKHYHENICPIWCYTETKPNDFCSYGERKPHD